MKSIKIEPRRLEGQIQIPPSKSISHRAVICAGLSEGISQIENVIFSEDIAATLDGMSAMGTRSLCEEAKDDENPCILKIEGTSSLKMSGGTIHCRESGSTLRFLIPLACKTGDQVTFTGQGKLTERPLDVYYQIFEEQGIEYHTDRGNLPLAIKGKLKPGNYKLKGNVSSQFISGLLFLLPMLDGDSIITITTELESRGYIDLTLDVQKQFGIEVENKEYKEFLIKGNQKYRSCNYRIEGDYSQAAFWLVAGTLGGKINCMDLDTYSLQGDREILNMIKKMGGQVESIHGGLGIQTALTHGTVIDAGQCPDLVPVLAVLASLSRGTTRIINAGRLRIKESDRLKAIATELNKLGAKVQELEEGLLIEGVESLQGGTVDSWNDHRIAMALAVASIKCRQPVVLTGFEAVKKSYPHFWRDFIKLGGEYA
ncbi:MAG: 3-phosphoshikimate 1-carboxyvinyltransferase [Candidatus Dichloromethanomonas elyunquensis]|nr:MAG: 3-phosphoshikimate 1-carboxyvinyltransferase [Candidatus Dichloromethanomonas elyunquensis]